MESKHFRQILETRNHAFAERIMSNHPNMRKTALSASGLTTLIRTLDSDPFPHAPRNFIIGARKPNEAEFCLDRPVPEQPPRETPTRI